MKSHCFFREQRGTATAATQKHVQFCDWKNEKNGRRADSQAVWTHSGRPFCKLSSHANHKLPVMLQLTEWPQHPSWSFCKTLHVAEKANTPFEILWAHPPLNPAIQSGSASNVCPSSAIECEFCCVHRMTAVGFEPTHPKIVELESTALNRSAKPSMQRIRFCKCRDVKNEIGMHHCEFAATCAQWKKIEEVVPATIVRI